MWIHDINLTGEDSGCCSTSRDQSWPFSTDPRTKPAGSHGLLGTVLRIPATSSYTPGCRTGPRIPDPKASFYSLQFLQWHLLATAGPGLNRQQELPASSSSLAFLLHQSPGPACLSQKDWIRLPFLNSVVFDYVAPLWFLNTDILPFVLCYTVSFDSHRLQEDPL